MKLIGKLTTLKFFPADPAGQKAVVEIACKMASSTEQIDWLVSQMLTWYNEWPGPREFRAVFCQRFKPQDGVNLNMSSVFPDGVFPGCAMFGVGPKELSPADVAERRKLEQPEARRLLQAIRDGGDAA
jgi:hypothetical protein